MPTAGPCWRCGAVSRPELRGFFEGPGFTEVECGILAASPGNEAHLHAFETEAVLPDGSRAARYYLHTSPEFAAKKLLAAGEEKIFEFARVFRNRERGRLHAPEFTMLEWYRARADYRAVIADTLALLASGRQRCRRPGAHLSGPQLRSFAQAQWLTVATRFRLHAGVELLDTHFADRLGQPRHAGHPRQARRLADRGP